MTSTEMTTSIIMNETDIYTVPEWYENISTLDSIYPYGTQPYPDGIYIPPEAIILPGVFIPNDNKTTDILNGNGLLSDKSPSTTGVIGFLVIEVIVLIGVASFFMKKKCKRS